MTSRRQRNANRGATTLPLRRRKSDPMREYDRLPPELRAWMREATLPWSPRSCLKIWKQARAKGEEVGAIIGRLERAERRTLEKTV